MNKSFNQAFEKLFQFSVLCITHYQFRWSTRDFVYNICNNCRNIFISLNFNAVQWHIPTHRDIHSTICSVLALFACVNLWLVFRLSILCFDKLVTACGASKYYYRALSSFRLAFYLCQCFQLDVNMAVCHLLSRII